MDPKLIAISARSIERIVAVLLGGLALYYGFRLFLVVPFETHSDGQIQLPGMSVVLSKAGPGLFFAAFGAVVIVTSLMQSVTVGRSGEPNGGATYQGAAEGPVPVVEARQTAAQTKPTEQELARVRLAIQTLNCLQRVSRASPKSLSPLDSEVAVRDAKLALLHSVWDASAWGEFDAFKQWAMGRSSTTTSSAKEIFETSRADCPQ
jgi:hypothetical protein